MILSLASLSPSLNFAINFSSLNKRASSQTRRSMSKNSKPQTKFTGFYVTDSKQTVITNSVFQFFDVMIEISKFYSR